MKYIKTFEGYSSKSLMVFENAEIGTPEQEALLNKSFDQLSEQEKEAAFKGIEELASNNEPLDDKDHETLDCLIPLRLQAQVCLL